MGIISSSTILIIWLYGVSNVFLERLGSNDDSWSPQQFEHVSITVLFFGGGLFGMMIESSWAKDLMSATTDHQKVQGESSIVGAGLSQFSAVSNILRSSEEGQWEQPKSYRISMNPMPALTIMLLGMMMSSHHQASMVSTMLHSQWGGLFSAFAMARGVTYVSMYLKPPTSHFAGRPPSEIVAAWCGEVRLDANRREHSNPSSCCPKPMSLDQGLRPPLWQVSIWC
jgi:hypothetical protein